MFQLVDGHYSVKCPKCNWQSESYPSIVFMDALDVWTLDLKKHIKRKHFFYNLYITNVTHVLHARITPDE
jgi:hypothetical protein